MAIKMTWGELEVLQITIRGSSAMTLWLVRGNPTRMLIERMGVVILARRRPRCGIVTLHQVAISSKHAHYMGKLGNLILQGKKPDIIQLRPNCGFQLSEQELNPNPGDITCILTSNGIYTQIAGFTCCARICTVAPSHRLL